MLVLVFVHDNTTRAIAVHNLTSLLLFSFILIEFCFHASDARLNPSESNAYKYTSEKELFMAALICRPDSPPYSPLPLTPPHPSVPDTPVPAAAGGASLAVETSSV